MLVGDPDDLISTHRDDTRYGDVLTDWRDIPKLKLLNLTYDLTPAKFVSMVITEVHHGCLRPYAREKFKRYPLLWLPSHMSHHRVVQVGMIPATSVPVILREYHKDQYID